MKLTTLATLLTIALSNFTLLFAQQTPKTDDEVVRISTNLVQVDAVVTGKNGEPVTDLTAADFEIFQDGKPQTITSLNYFNTELSKTNRTDAKKRDKDAPFAPSANVRPENAGRILTFIIDDGNCRASRVGMLSSRQALEKFVSEIMRPDDLVAVYRTRGGSSVLQQYTSDKSQLMRVARQIRWYPPRGICGGDATGDFFNPARTNETFKLDGKGADSFENRNDRESRSRIENRIRDNQVVGFLGVLRYITRGLQKVSGRKTVFLLSDGIPLFSVSPEVSGSANSQVATMNLGDAGGAMRDLVDLANRASVVFNTIDVRGIGDPGREFSAQDDFAGFRNNTNATGREAALRTSEYTNSQSGMFYLANETGGRFYDDVNNLEVPVRRILNLEKGYYLIGYQPDENTFKSKKFNRIEIKIKRDGLKVRSRSGFYGVTDENLRPSKRTGDSELYEALIAPLPNAGLDLRVTAFFGNTPEEGSFVRALLYLDGERLTFTDEPNGMKKAVFDVVAVTLDGKNEVVEDFNRTHTIRFPAASAESVRRNGVIYTADVPVKKAGAYNFRVAIRDAASRLIGTAGQQIEVPDLRKTDLFLSGLIVSEVEIKNGKPVMPEIEKARNEFAPVSSVAIPAIRRFRPGAILGYSYEIYDAIADKNTEPSKLTTQIRLYKDGQVIVEGVATALPIKQSGDWQQSGDYGFLRLPPDTQIGDYALQIIIKNTQKNETVSQWVDFEVVN